MGEKSEALIDRYLEEQKGKGPPQFQKGNGKKDKKDKGDKEKEEY